MIEQEGGVERRIAIVDHFKVDGHHGAAGATRKFFGLQSP